MKIRILGHSIRLRLSQTEVQQLFEKGEVRQETRFIDSESDLLIYSLEKNGGKGIGTSFENGHIRIFVNDKMTDEWASSNQVGMEEKRPGINNETLSILIEKDFKCMTDRGEDESDLFPNPTENC